MNLGRQMCGDSLVIWLTASHDTTSFERRCFALPEKLLRHVQVVVDLLLDEVVGCFTEAVDVRRYLSDILHGQGFDFHRQGRGNSGLKPRLTRRKTASTSSNEARMTRATTFPFCVNLIFTFNPPV